MHKRVCLFKMEAVGSENRSRRNVSLLRCGWLTAPPSREASSSSLRKVDTMGHDEWKPEGLVLNPLAPAVSGSPLDKSHSLQPCDFLLWKIGGRGTLHANISGS